MSKVVADDHDSTVATYDFALIANLLDARLYLHDQTLLTTSLLVPVNDSTSCEVIWTEFYDHAIFRQDADVVLSHLPADVCENFVSIRKFHPKHCIG